MPRQGGGWIMAMPDWLVVLLLAPCIGSFLGVLIRRLPAGRPVLLGRSACAACGHRLSAAELVPLLSYAWQRGKCRECAAPIDRFHPLIELAALVVALVAVLAGDDGARLWLGCALGWALLALSWIDAETMTLPDALTLPLLLAGLAATILLDPAAAPDHAAAALLGWLLFCAIGWGFRRLRGVDGLGGGDARLLAAGGAWLGLAALPWIMAGAALAGLAMAGAMALAGQAPSRLTRLPFGPALALAIWVAWLAG